MAKKKAAAAVKPSEVMQVPSEKEFTSHNRAVKNADADISDAQSVKSTLMKRFVEKHHGNKKAFSTFKTAERLSDKKLADFRAHLDHYFEVGGLNARIERQAEMFDRAQELAETKVEAVTPNGSRKKRGAKDKKNVVPFENQRQREAAGEFDPADGEVEQSAVH